MPDGPMEKGVGAGVAGIPVLPPELMPSSTLTVLVSKKVFVYSLTNFAPKKHAGYLHGKLFVKTRNVNCFQLLLQVLLDKCRLCIGHDDQLTINPTTIRIIDGRDLIKTNLCAAYIFLSVNFEIDDCILPEIERDSSFKILTTTFSLEIPAASCSARIECWKKKNVKYISTTTLAFDSGVSVQCY